MKRAKAILGFALKLVLLTTLLNLPPAVFAQSDATEPAGEEESLVESDEQSIAIRLEDLVVVGTRVRGVARQDLAVPVDVYEVNEMTAASGTADLAVALQQVAPSFNSQRNALGDGGLFHSALLRGMSPNHTLILVNGKRRHGISFPRPLETALQGTTGVDLRAIPIASIERIEVLRDGAASQYGSDAIGGVINIVLKQDAEESVARAEAGVTGEGDGQRFGASANVGLPLGSQGSLNLTLEVFDQARTDRAFDTSHLDVGGPHDPPIGRKLVLGEPEYDFKALWLNALAPLGSDMGELYAFGGWSQRSGLSSGARRDPVWSPDRMVGPVHPDGFLPFEESTSEDLATAAGIRSSLGEWDYDLSLNYGVNTFDFGAIDSINASWAAAWLQQQLDQGRPLSGITPAEIVANSGQRSGDSGGTQLGAWSLDFELTGTIAAIDAAFGAEYRQERFRIRAGDFASYGCGLPDARGEAPAVTLDDGNVAQHGDLARCGHQGYPGYSPINAQFGARDRGSHALWADFRHDVNSAWNLETAVRWEQYPDAGDSVTGMVGSRLKLSPNASLRATASTGFRVPSLPELGFNTIVFKGTAQGGLTVTASLEDGAANRFFGVGSENLQHETSHSLSGGVILTPGAEVSISADVFWIEVSDRIVATGYTPDCEGADAAGCARLIAERQLPRITDIQFYDNVVDTRTTGLDVVATHDREFLSGELTLTGALHFNETEITAGRDTIAPYRQSYIEEGNPRQRHRIAADWADDTLNLHLGMNYFGKAAPQWILADPDCPGEISPAWVTNASAGWRLGGVRLSVGIDNALDEYPDAVNPSCSELLNNVLGWGIQYSGDAAYGLSGRIFWTRVDARF